MKTSFQSSHTAKGFELVVYSATIVGPLTAIPQILKTWSLKSAHELSLTMWVTGLVLAGIWFAYGIQKKDKPIIITNFLWLRAYPLSNRKKLLKTMLAC